MTARGINRPSPYNAFGNKEATFRPAVRRYSDTEMAYLSDAIAEPTGRAVAEHYPRADLTAITAPGKPPGCLTVQGGLAGGAEDDPRRALLLGDAHLGPTPVPFHAEHRPHPGDLRLGGEHRGREHLPEPPAGRERHGPSTSTVAS